MDIMDIPSPFAAPQPSLPAEFEKLRHMDQFSEQMFNHIIAFQERLHPAWNETLPFAERIKELPLHALVFSNPDRDPAHSGPTIAPYYPLRGEMIQLAHMIRQISERPMVADIHPANGFIGSLLANEGVPVIGLRDPAAKPNQIKNFFDSECYQMVECGLADWAKQPQQQPIDVILSSWMPAGQNVTPQIVAHQPKLIIYIHTEHHDESTGLQQTGTEEAFTALPARYQLICDWSITRPLNLFSDVWPDLTPSIEETRQVKVYADTPWHDIDIGLTLQPAAPYDWELDLEMALTALQAKAMLREQGFPV